MFKIHAISVLSIAPLLCAYSADLLEVLHQAAASDYQMRNYKYTNFANEQYIPIARASLFPTVNLSASISSNSVQASGNKYRNRQWPLTLNISQTLFDYGKFQSFLGSKWLVLSSEFNYEEQKQQFIYDVANAYFTVLQYKDILDSNIAAQNSNRLAYTQAKERKKVGLATQNDVLQALASYDSSRASVIQSRNDLQTQIFNLSVYTGKVYTDLNNLDESFLFNLPKYSLDKWVKLAQSNNKKVKSQQYNQEYYSYNLSGAKASFLPNLNIAAAYGHTGHNGTFQTTAPAKRNYSVALNLSWNLFNGGKDFATVEQNAYNFGAQEADTIYQIRFIMAQTKADYKLVESNMLQVKANLAAVNAQKEAVKQALAQYEAGVSPSSSSDNDNASDNMSGMENYLYQISLLLASEQAYAKSKYDYLTSSLALAHDAGVLSIAEIKSLNTWLVRKELLDSI